MTTTMQWKQTGYWLRLALLGGLAAFALLVAFALLGSGQTQASSSATAIGASSDATCVRTNLSAVQCWGSLSNSGYGVVPVNVSGLGSNINAISVGGGHACALTSGGGVKCWGANSDGQVGNASTSEAFAPVDVTGLTSGVAAISAGKQHTCALTSGGGVKCWGDNQFGGLGNNSTVDSTTPVDVSGLASGVAALASGNGHTCALMSGGGVKCWGYNMFGQIGNNSQINAPTPVDVSGLTSGVAKVSAGSLVTCAVTTGGALKCWGANGKGELGIGTSTGPDSCTGFACAKTPQNVSGLGSGVSSVSIGSFDACALIASGGGVKCWGWNQAGQLGIGTTSGPNSCGSDDCSTVPVAVPGVFGAVSIATGWYHNCAVLANGGVKCWGWNRAGQLGNGTDEGPELCSFGAFVDKACSTTQVQTLLLGPVKPPATPTPLPVFCPVSPNQVFPNPGCEVVEVSGTFTANITSPVVDTFTCPLRGPMQVARYQNPSSPHDGDSDTRHDTDIEILYSNLQGVCTAAMTPGAFPIIVRQDPARQSLGLMEEATAGDPDFFPANAVVNAFAIIDDISAGRELHTENSVSMECLGFSSVPITGCTFSYIGSLAGQQAGGAAGAPPPVALFDEDGTQVGTLTNASLTPNAVDSDMDSCSDQDEGDTATGSQMTGGRRNSLNFWDYADMPNANGIRDRRIRVDDIVAVLDRYFTDDAGATAPTNRYSDPLLRPAAIGYHPAFDRTLIGPELWQLGPPNGQIGVDDILHVVRQYFHDCV